MEGAEEIGTALTGTLAAHAIEPEAGGHQKAAHGTCLNCGAAVTRNFCGECGQAAHVHRTLGAFWHDLLHGVLHFEGKIWRTLPLLAWRPGELTRRYVEGERARFVSPLAMFLFSVFLMFAVVSALGAPLDLGGSTAVQDRAEAETEYRQERAESETELKDLTAQLERARAAGQSTQGIEQRIDGVRLELELQRDAYELAMRLANDEEARAAEQAEREKSGATAEGKTVLIGGADELNDWFNRAYQKAKKNPSLLLYKLQTNAYKFSWMLIPISVPFLWLLFLHRRRYRRQYKAYDHVVFVTYSIAFMSLGFIVLTLLRPLGIGGAVSGLAITFIPPIHMYRQLRGAYQLSRFSALWRTFVLLIFASIAAGIFLGVLVILGVLG